MGSERWNGQNIEGAQLLLLLMPSLFNCSISTLIFPPYTIAPFPPSDIFQPIASPPLYPLSNFPSLTYLLSLSP